MYAIEIILYTGFGGFEMVANLAEDASVGKIFGAIRDEAASFIIELVRIPASETRVSEISFGFGLLELSAVGDSALAINFLEWWFTVFASTILIDASGFFYSNNSNLRVISRLFNQVSS